MIRTWSTRCLLLLGGAAAAAVPGAHAQEPASPAAEMPQARRISLADALGRLETRNLELRLAREEVAASEARVVAAGMFPNPGLTATREQLSGDEGRNDETVLALGQTLEIGGQRGARRQAARQAARAAEARFQAERQRIAFEVHQAYVRAAAAEADLTSLAEATAVVRRVEESGRTRFAEGDISRFDSSRLQIERARYETLLARRRLDLDEAARELALLIAPDSLAAPAALLPAEPLSGLAAVEQALELEAALAAASERAEVRAAEAEVDAARSRLSLARRERIPDVTVSGGYKHQADGLQGAVIGLSVPVPLLNRNQGEVAEAEAQLQAAQARHDLALARAQAEIRRAWDVHRSLRERMRTLGETLLPESAGLLETARVAYAEGEMSLVELLDAADAYRSARESVNLLLSDYLISIYDLGRATGALLEPTTTTDASSR